VKKPFVLSLLLVALAPFAFAKSLLNINDAGVGIQGYDPVAYFTEGRAVKGDPRFQSRSGGVIYHFAGADHRDAFDANPAKYEPLFGGFCAWAVSKGYTAPVDPNAFQIVDGRLFLQYSLRVREGFNKDTAGNLKKAEANWPGLVEKKGK
jgi:YHS domain-containing protein